MVTPCKVSTENLKKIMKKIVVLIDTREKQNQHIVEYLDKHHIAHRNEKLDFCDYSFMLQSIPEMGIMTDLYFHKGIAIERKASLEELSGNISKGRETFENELMRATHAGCKLYLMVENPFGYSAIMQKQYHTEVSAASFMATLKTYEQRYGLNIQFITPDNAGYLIVSTFQYFLREYFK